MKNNIKISKIDRDHLGIIRRNVAFFVESCAKRYDQKDKVILDIAPQDHVGAKGFFKKSKIKTLDINSKATCDYTADICRSNTKIIPNSSFDFVLCTEVLEHTLEPSKAVKEIKRILKSGGLLFLSVPFNFRIHGPLPDCWRFTEHGLRHLFRDFIEIDFKSVDTKFRDLMPVHYTFIFKKK
jgi:SAM-dependent methyltransferase